MEMMNQQQNIIILTTNKISYSFLEKSIVSKFLTFIFPIEILKVLARCVISIFNFIFIGFLLLM
ncbi:hypothetical protein D7Y09_16495 [bacterium 1XD42-1]|nr:hypothetical protein D7Y09_16495 [bacterium 1XD42-1]